MLALSYSFVAALVVSATLCEGAMHKRRAAAHKRIGAAAVQRVRVHRPQGKHHHHLTNNGTVSAEKLAQNLAGLSMKYNRNLDNYHINMGKPNVLRSAKPSLARRGEQVNLDNHSFGYWSVDAVVGGGSVVYAMECDLDTGSSDTIFGPQAYDGSQSPTKQDTDRTFKTGFGDGSNVTGIIMLDDFRINDVTAKGQALGIKPSTDKPDTSCLSGMAYPSIASFKSDPWYNTAMGQSAVPSGEFAFHLAADGSFVELGGISKDVTWHPLSQNAWWITTASVNSLPIHAVIDSGTTLIVADTTTANALFASLGLETEKNGNGITGKFDCKNPPKISFQFEDQVIELSEETTSFGTWPDGQCATSIVGADIGIDGWILGDAFMRNVYSAFSFEKNAVGFAPP